MGRPMRLPLALALAALFFPAPPAPAQESRGEDPSVFIGFSLGELFEIRGAPDRVYALRGYETWQDDVVFVYGDLEFYFYRNRVWQIGAKNVFGIKTGDRRETIPLVMGDATLAGADYSLAELPGRAWPMNARFNVDGRGIITSIYVYRSDF